MERVQVYRSWTAIIQLEDVEALGKEKEMESLVTDIGGVLAKTFDNALVGYTWDWPEHRLLVTLKTFEQATILADTWERLVNEIVTAL